MDGVNYIKKQEEDFSQHEALCRRCGFCCGAEAGEPCINLKKDTAGRYFCAAYDNRLGPQTTVSGKNFTCVPIREVLSYAPPHDGCGYSRQGGI